MIRLFAALSIPTEIGTNLQSRQVGIGSARWRPLEALHVTLECLPEHLWTPMRRKRTYVNQVLARAEVHSPYQPARQLWVRIMNGHYLPNPLLQLRAHGGDELPNWRPVFEVLNLGWVDAGTSESAHPYLGLASRVDSATRRATVGNGHAPASASATSGASAGQAV